MVVSLVRYHIRKCFRIANKLAFYDIRGQERIGPRVVIAPSQERRGGGEDGSMVRKYIIFNKLFYNVFYLRNYSHTCKLR